MSRHGANRPLSIVGIGGTTVPGSSTEQALALALAAAEAGGAKTMLFGGEALGRLPHYARGLLADLPEARALVEAVRGADGLVIASPGYHGSVSGLVKNAIDFIEETARDDRVYLDGLPVGLIVTAHGWQAMGSTLATLRSIVHALRGWPTPLGAAIRAADGNFAEGADQSALEQLQLVGRQVVEFARLHKRAPSITFTGPVEGA
ncbi:MAG: FMN reductase [Sphingomonas sp. SCN 67-18]|uniref:NADPH-dependent FMN reductase n=1 Tax=uncultured Sphingomonas sp. TaxID=158754 RepID=UPI00086AA268|nr:NADPH-dependent FMN reductase [Sphingomonas sp. SCN 67-18]ODU20716.1 MAG: FMN reductase [Sphingomonas sp. SCN 67-18]